MAWLHFIILFLSFHLGLFCLNSTTETGLLVSWLQAWHVDVPLRNNEGNYDTRADGILAFHLERFWMRQPLPMLTIILANFFGFFFTANYEWDRIFGSSCKTAHAAEGFEPRWRHSQSCQLSPGIGCGSLVVLDLQAALSTSLLFFPLFIFFFYGGILDSNCSVEENAFNNSHPQLLTSCMNERMCCKWSVPKCGISI